jgi:hypothetical protein
MNVPLCVTPGLVPGIHACIRHKTWMAGTSSPAMTAAFNRLDADSHPNSLVPRMRRGEE